ncbi:MAG: ABC-2 transporter permease [Spirochaetales bacterium]|nr:ABC-2 transporter permease [Spirochaetales bacterium]
MLSLVYKDFLLQRGSKAFVYMIILPIAGALSIISETQLWMLPYLAGSYMYIIYANALDDKHRTEKLLLSMPISRNTIVLSKYLGIFFYMIAFLVLSFICSFFAILIIPQEDPSILSIQKIIETLIMTSIYFGLQLPLTFKLGYQNSRWVNYFSLLFSIGLYIAILKGTNAIYNIDVASLQEAAYYITRLSTGIWNLILIAASTVITFISVKFSIKYYKEREF